MSQTDNLTPLELDALREAYRSPTHTLVRMGRHYVAQHQRESRSGVQKMRLFTGRVMNRLDRRALVDFDPPQFPERVILSKQGLAFAEQLAAEDALKAPQPKLYYTSGDADPLRPDQRDRRYTVISGGQA